MFLCNECDIKGFCVEIKIEVVKLSDLQNPQYVYDIRDFCFRLGISRDAWLERLTDWLRDFNGQFVDDAGRIVEIDLESFDTASIRYYFRDNCCARPNRNGFVHPNALARFQVMASIIKARFPSVAETWGKRNVNRQHVPPCSASA